MEVLAKAEALQLQLNENVQVLAGLEATEAGEHAEKHRASEWGRCQGAAWDNQANGDEDHSLPHLLDPYAPSPPRQVPLLAPATGTSGDCGDYLASVTDAELAHGLCSFLAEVGAAAPAAGGSGVITWGGGSAAIRRRHAACRAPCQFEYAGERGLRGVTDGAAKGRSTCACGCN